MSALLNWLDDRTGVGDFWKRCASATMPGRPCLCRSMATVIALLVLVQLITGAIMFMYYSPSTQTAWESVYFFQYEVTCGWFVRAVHHYAAQTLLVVIGIYLVGMVCRGATRAPREFVFWTVVTMGLLTLGLLLTGDLLEWDQNSQTATNVRTKFLLLLPVIGESLRKLALGGPDFGHLTLTRFLTYHIVMADIFVVLTAALLWFRHRAVREEVQLLPASRQSAYWPGQAIANMIACCIAMGVVLALALSHGTTGIHRGLALGVPANAIESYNAARPEWAFMGLYGFVDLFPDEIEILPVFGLTTLIVILLYLIPFYSRFRAGRIFSILLVLFLLVGNFYLAYDVYARDAEDEDYQKAVAEYRETSDRVIELIQKNGGIPTGGALELVAIARELGTAEQVIEILGKNDELPPEKMISVEKAMETINNDPVRIFKQHCATCHAYVGGTKQDIPAEDVSAPNLFGYGTKEWISGWLDSKRINGPDYFGKTAFRRGGKEHQMVDFVMENYEEPDEIDREEIQAMVMALYGRSGKALYLDYHENYDEDDGMKGVVKQFVSGQKYIVEYCAECHRIGDKGNLGVGPELTDYTSPEWTRGIIANPAAKRFYGDKNDRMPAYAEFEDESRNTLNNRQIDALVKWLRTPPPGSETKKPEPKKEEEEEDEE